MSDFVRGAVKKTTIISAFVMCAALSAILLWEGVLGQKIAHDYAVYWRTANEPIEAAYALHPKPFPYAPTMFAWIYPLGFIPRATGYLLVSLAGIFAIVLACRRYLSRAAMVLTLISPAMFRCIRNGQVSAILTAMMIWACGTSNRIAAGLAFGVIASIKPQLVIMAPLMLTLNRDWRAFWAAASTFALAVLMSLIFGPERWSEWLASMDHFHSVVVETDVLGIAASPAAVAEKFGLNPLPFMVMGALAGAALVYFCRDANPLEKATAIGAGSILAAPYALTYDLIVITPLLAAAVMRGQLPAFVGISAMLNPFPLLVAGFDLLASRKRPGRDGVASVGVVAGNT
jgi:hypothetical protein